jgi:hypothetical protein
MDINKLPKDMAKDIETYIGNSKLYEIKISDDELGVIVDIWEKNFDDEPTITTTFWYDDYIYYFEDWVSDMLNSSDYSEFELMCFEEHYQNLLTFEENTEIFMKTLNN